MKSLFSRLRHKDNNRDAQSASRPPSSQSLDKDARVHHSPSSRRSSSYSTPRVDHDRTETPSMAPHSQSSSSSSDSTRPHSIIGLSDEEALPITKDIDADETIRLRTISAGDGGNVKKVTFRSPAPTPTTSLVLDEIPAIPDAPLQHIIESRGASQESRRVVSTSPRKSSVNLPQLPSGQVRSVSRQSLPHVLKPIMTRKSSLQMTSSGTSSPVKSAMSPTPSEQSLGSLSTTSYLPQPNSWSEMAEDDLIANLGPRERTRQEVLWEIVSSEER